MRHLWNFDRVRFCDKILVHGKTRLCQLLGLTHLDFQERPQKLGTENYLTCLVKYVCKNISSRTTGLFCRSCWINSACSLFSATTSQMFSQSLSSHTLCSCLEVFFTTNNICNLWHSNFQQVSTLTICS